MNKNLYLTRHALATISKHGYGSKILTAEILPEGIEAYKQLALFLKNIPKSLNIASEILRCRQSSDIISQVTQKQFIYDKRLNEFYKEKFSDFKKRVNDFLKNLEKHDSQDIVICTHGIVIAAIKNYILKNKFTFKDRNDYPETGELVIIKNGEIKTINFN